MATNTERLEFRAEKAFIHSIEELARISNTSKAEVIRRAVNLYAYAVEEAKKGNELKSQPSSQLAPSQRMEQQDGSCSDLP